MKIDFNNLKPEQIDLLVTKITNKFNSNNIDIETFSNLINIYRKNRYNTGILKILEGDEILKGNFYKLGKKEKITKLPKVEINKNNDVKKVDEISEEMLEVEVENISENNDFLLSENISRLNRLRLSTSSSYVYDGTKNNNIVLDENIEQIESKFSLKEINSQLPSENLLDRYNFGYVNLIDDDDGLKQSAFKETRPKIK